MVSWKGGLALIVLTVQNTSVPIMMRMARTGEQGSTHSGEYCVPLLVLLQEVFKLTASIFLLIVEKRSVSAALHSIVREALNTPTTTLNLAIPAILYFVMNNSIQHAAAYLPAAVFQVVYQVKILVVALMSVLLLNKHLEAFKWASIFSLAFGVALVQYSRAPDKHSTSDNVLFGLIYALVAAVCSGLSGVFFEMMIKRVPLKKRSSVTNAKPSLWLRNFQLALFSIVFAIPSVYYSPSFKWRDPLGSFDNLVWALGINNAVGGLIVALVVKHANNIHKCFSNAISTVMATSICIPLFHFEPSAQFALGAGVVLLSSLVYGQVISFSCSKEKVQDIEMNKEHQ